MRKRTLTTEEMADSRRLKAIWDARENKRELTQQAVANAIGDGVTQGAVSHYLNGINAINLKAALVFSRMLDVEVGAFSPSLAKQLNTGAGMNNVVAIKDHKKNSRTIEIPRFDVAGAMGAGRAAPAGYEEVVDRISVSKDYLHTLVSFSSPENLAIMTGLGDSMKGTYNDGDLLLVDRGVNVIDVDAVYVVLYQGELYVKRFQRRPGKPLLMISDNKKKYDPVEIGRPEASGFTVLARVLMAWNAVRL